jgi:hypothetical protein
MCARSPRRSTRSIADASRFAVTKFASPR